jgi:hypothetical protein
LLKRVHHIDKQEQPELPRRAVQVARNEDTFADDRSSNAPESSTSDSPQTGSRRRTGSRSA